MNTTLPPTLKFDIFTKECVLKKFPRMSVVAVLLILSAAAGQDESQTYRIKNGDTLWDLAFKFLGDPFLWPQLWHQNKYIANPNLIYPGNILVIRGNAEAPQTAVASGAAPSPGAASVASVGASQGATAASQGGDDFFSETKQALDQSEHRGFSQSSRAGSSTGEASHFSDTLFRFAIQAKSYFTPEFLERIAFLWDRKDEKGLMYPGNATLEKMNAGGLLNRYDQQTFQPNDDVIVELFPSARYHPGDTIDVFHSYGLVRFQGKTVNAARRIAKGLIRSVNGTRASAVLFRMWDVVQQGDRVDTAAHFPCLQIDTLVDPPASIKATIFMFVENSEYPYPFQTFIVDKGTRDGIALGDVFSVTSKNDVVVRKSSALACAVKVGEVWSTLVIERLSDAIRPGDTVSVVKQIKFK